MLPHLNTANKSQSPPHKSLGHSASVVISFLLFTSTRLQSHIKPHIITIYIFFCLALHTFFFLASLLLCRNMDSLVWDRDSKLYDSFEVSSIKRQIGSAMAGRCLSDPIQLATVDRRKKKSKLSKSLLKLLRSVFGFKQTEAEWLERYRYGVADETDEVEESGYPVRWSGGGLASIPEVSEKGIESPEIDYSAVRKAMSERFTSSTSGAVLVRIPAP